MHDIIQDSPIFQEILREGMEKGLEQGRLEAARHILLIVTEKRFPTLVALAQEQATHTQALDEIDSLIVAVSSAQNELEAYNLLRGYK